MFRFSDTYFMIHQSHFLCSDQTNNFHQLNTNYGAHYVTFKTTLLLMFPPNIVRNTTTLRPWMRSVGQNSK